MNGQEAGSAITSKRRAKKLWIFSLIVVLVLGAILLPPYLNLSRYRRTVADSISRSMGRTVSIGSVQLRLLPMPALELSNFVVEEDSAFGVEPALRSGKVVATLRLSSLWRGHLEVSRINLDQPSLNLVKDTNGRWSVGSLLIQASRIPNAPTAQRRSSSAPRFPYIEASSARINFKENNEKKPFSLLNADLAIWLAKPDQWQLRVEAQPARTDLDLDLEDTGTLRIEGSLNRAATLDAMPIDMQLEWSKAPVGQMSRLVLGSNTDWRGDLRVTASLTGTVNDLKIKTRIEIANTHHREFAPLAYQEIDATCEGDLYHNSHSIQNLTCLWPVGSGHLLLTGDIPDYLHPQPQLRLEINRIPTSFAVGMLGMLRQRAGSATTSGIINGEFSWQPSSRNLFTGHADVQNLAVNFSGLDRALTFPVVHFTTPADQPQPVKKHGKHAPLKTALVQHTPTLLLENTPVLLGAPAPLTISGTFTGKDFSLHLAGPASVAHLSALTTNFGLLNASLAAIGKQGRANLDITVQGPWVVPPIQADHPESATFTHGTVQLQNAEWRTNFLPDPVQIVSATAHIEPAQIVWSDATLTFHQIPVHASLSYPAICAAGLAMEENTHCLARFTLETASLDAAALQSALLGAGDHGELLDSLLARIERHTANLPSIEGSIHATTFTLGTLTLHNATAAIAAQGSGIRITSLDGATLGGALHAAGLIETASGSPVYNLKLELNHASVADIAAIFHEHWGTGIFSGTTQIKATGFTPSALAKSSAGNFHWDWQKGSLAGIATTANHPLAHFDHWITDGTIQDSMLKLAQGQLDHNAETGTITGNISFDRQLNLKLITAEGHQSIAGTLPKPTVEAEASATASLH